MVFVVRSPSVCWRVILFFMFMGMGFRIFLQCFPATAALFVNIINFTIDIERIDLIMVAVGFFLTLKVNLGALLGTVNGVVIAR